MPWFRRRPSSAAVIKDTFALAAKLLSLHVGSRTTATKRPVRSEHDLIHKAVGWMLREAGKRDEAALRQFLKQHYADLPRTVLRYAIERWSLTERKDALGGRFTDST